MFRRFNINNKQVEDKIVIYKNIRQKLGVINPEWIDKINYKHKDISQFNLTIPQYIGKDKKYNPIYDKVFSGQFIVINDTEKYILREKQGSIFKKDGKKTFACYSYEKTFENKKVTIDGGNYQLISNDVVITEGILETVLGYTRYKIGDIDHDAMYQIQIAEDTETLKLFKDYTKTNVQFEQLLWEKDFNIDIGDNPLYININYLNIKTVNKGQIVKEGERVYTTFTDGFYTGIKHIKCYYITQEANRWACKYVITLKDGVVQEYIYPFTNITGYDVAFDVELTYGLGTYTEKELIKLPYFDTIDDNILNVLRDIEDAFDCTLDFDHINKTINVMANKNVGITKGTILSFDTNVLELGLKEDAVIPSSLKIIGKDGLSISTENPFGGDTIYNYDYYMKFMSEECKLAWNRYMALVTIKQEEFRMLRDNRQIINNRMIRLDIEIKSLEDRIKYTKSLLSTFVAQGDKENQAKTKADYDILEAKFNEYQRNRAVLKEQIQGFDDDIKVIANALNRDTSKDEQGKIFNEDDLDELDSYTVVETLEDDYYTVPSALYLESVRILADKVIPKYEWDLKSTDVTKVSENWRKNITLGDLFKTEGKVKSSIGQDRVRLVGITYIPSTGQVTGLEYTNKDKKDDVLKKYANNGRKTSGNNNVINSWNNVIQDAMLSNNLVKSLVDNGLNLATMQINGRSVKNILDVGTYGIYVSDTESKNGSYLGSNLFAISKDGWETSEIAISTEGINAKLLISTIILGEKLCITSEDSLFYVGVTDEGKEGFGLKICDSVDMANPVERVFLGLEKDSDGVRRAKLRLRSKKNGELVLSEDGVVQFNQFNQAESFDYEHPMVIPFRSMEGTTKYENVTLTLTFEHYRAHERSASGGGGYSTSTTTSNGGSYVNTITSTESSVAPYQVYTSEEQNNTDGHHVHSYFMSLLEHSHRTYINISPHYHSYSINIDPHIHNLIYGIYEDTKPSNCAVYVNDVLVSQSLFDSCELNITPHIKTNQMNIIKITSVTRGRITANIASKFFQQW